MSQSPTSRTLEKGLFGMALPLLGEYVLNMSVPVIDALYLSRISDQAAAAVGAVTPWFAMAITLFSATGIAGASLASQYMGKKNYPRANLMLAGLVIIGMMTSLLAGCFFWFQAGDIGHWMGLPEEMATIAGSYLVIAGSGVGLMGFRMMLGNMCNSYGQAQWNTLSVALMFLVKIVGNSIVVFGWFGVEPMGVQGVALVSIVAWSLALVLNLLALLLVIKVRLPLMAALRQPALSLKPILRIAVPSSLEPFSFQSFMMVLSVLVVGFGEHAIAARVYTLNIYSYCIMFLVSIGVANTMLITQLAGAGRFEECRQQMVQGIRWALGIVIGMVLVILLLHRWLLGLFTQEQAILTMGLGVCLIHTFQEPMRAVNIIAGNVLRGCGDAVFVTATAIGVTWLISAPLAYVVASYTDFGLYGVLSVALLDETLRGQVNWRRWQSGRWMRKLAQD
ncbi:MATE family efflux transporter [Aliagarivorans taiwanensis]|uniref:MATE family efflux transporter n=1 Tax=Aliagarivorans taiwanensis TaxID=561966 RepID=UPI0009FBB8CF|nr:MATE family efflux transporter [Aliagarivorans taiwanensis]